VEISEPTGADGSSRPSWTHLKIWRSAFFLVGSLVGVLVGVALLTILAHPAGASALPDPPSVPGVQSVSGSVPLAAVAGSTASVVPVAEAAVSDISSISANTMRQAPSLADPVVGTVAPPIAIGAGALVPPTAGAVPSILPTTVQGAPSASGGSGSPAVPHVGSVRAVPTQRSEVASATAGPVAPAPLRSTPIVPSPVPTTPFPSPISPISPLALSDASSYSAPVQGVGPLGLLPPSSVLLAALAVGAVLMAREKKLPLLLDSRCSPPG
jgi:hypothetical protein